ncbi:MAG: hypothetical protein LBP39_01185, partial [Rickettsiales bacterium]|nr:hypothetical protein [Rickettsiales bacterium]
MSKNKKYNYSGGETARINLSLDDLERLPLRDLISKSPGELFALQKLISRDFGRARSRREWLRNIIELKYQGILEKLRRKATEHFKHPLSSDRVCY